MLSGITNYDCLFQIMLLGDEKSGKSELLKKFITPKESLGKYSATVATDSANKMVLRNAKTDNKIMLQIVDTSGQERFSYIRKNFYQNTHAIIICVDSSHEWSAEYINKWLTEISEYHPKNIPIIIALTKADLPSRFTKEQVFQYLSKNHPARNISADNIIECSAETGANVNIIFERAAELTYQKYSASRAIKPPLFENNDTYSTIDTRSKISKLITTLEREIANWQTSNLMYSDLRAGRKKKLKSLTGTYSKKLMILCNPMITQLDLIRAKI